MVSSGSSGGPTFDGSFFLGNLTNVFSLQLEVLFTNDGGRVEIDRIVANFPDTCVNGLDDDGDGLVDAAEDPGCRSERDGSELSTLHCDDAIDNDGDGRIDWRADGSGDPECVDPNDTREAAPNPTTDPPSAGGCGLGPELLGLVTALAWLRRRAHATA
jgi:hypothetical protein